MAASARLPVSLPLGQVQRARLSMQLVRADREINDARARVRAVMGWAGQRDQRSLGIVEIRLVNEPLDGANDLLHRLRQIDPSGQLTAAVLLDVDEGLARAGIYAGSAIGELYFLGAVAAALGDFAGPYGPTFVRWCRP